jgi:hypothetical protein
MIRLIIFLSVLLSFTGCTTKPVKEQTPFEVNYRELLDEEITGLEVSERCLKKHIYYSGNKESKTDSTPDWRRELRPFMDCDVQKPSFDKLYTASTSYSGDSTLISYTARGESSQVRQVDILLLQKKLNKINARIRKKNSYFELAETLEFRSMDGYTIKGSQKMLFASETVYQIEAQFMPCR